MQRNRHSCSESDAGRIRRGMARPRLALIELLRDLIRRHQPEKLVLPEIPDARLETPFRDSRINFNRTAGPRFMLVLAGTYRVAREPGSPKSDRRLGAGTLLWVPAGAGSLSRWKSRRTVLAVVFHPDYTRYLWYHHRGDDNPESPPPLSLWYHTRRPAGPLLRQQVAILEGAVADPHLAGRRADSARALLAWCLQELLDDESPAAAPHPRFRQIRAYVEEHLQGDLSRETVARRFRMTPDHLTRLFREQARCRFVDFVREERIRLAEQLVPGSSLSVKEIAAACGFRTPWYFIRRFREKFGATPQAWRKARG